MNVLLENRTWSAAILESIAFRNQIVDGRNLGTFEATAGEMPAVVAAQCMNITWILLGPRSAEK